MCIMGKVKGEVKFPNEVAAVNKKKKKRRKELDLLRRKVLDAKKKLREKTAPPKTHTSTFNKILNSFADRRQANDNNTQGFDSKGRKAGRKKICPRLLPSRKPEVGIFANGTKGAEIERVDLSLNEIDRARFEGDLQKVLGEGRSKMSKDTKPDVHEILHRPPTGPINMETEGFVEISRKKLGNRPAKNHSAERQSGKRKIQVSVDLNEKTVKKPHSEMEHEKVQYNKVKSELKNLTNKKCKRSLFQDEAAVGEFEQISVPDVGELRFSPTIGKAKVKVELSEPKIFPNKAQERTGVAKPNFHYNKQFGKIAITEYENLCALICTENFDTCLKEIPHIDPLKKVKQSLINFYAETYKQKALRSKLKIQAFLAKESLGTSFHPIRSNVHRNEYIDEEDSNVERSKSDVVNVSSFQDVCLGNLNNFCYWGGGRTSLSKSKPLISKTSEIKKGRNISCVTRDTHSYETNISAEDNTSSLDVNYGSSRKSLNSDILEFNKSDGEAGSSVVELEGITNSRLAGIPSHRKKIVQRYIKEVNNLEPLKEDGSICPVELSAVSAENNDVQKCYLGKPSRRHEIRTKQTLNSPEKERLEELRGPPSSGVGIADETLNPFNANYKSIGTCSGLDIGEFLRLNGRAAAPTFRNLGSVSSSRLARIPSDREKIMLKFLQDVNNRVPITVKDRDTYLPEGIVVPFKDDKLGKPHVSELLTKHQVKTTLIDRSSKIERHVPSILRKSRVTKKHRRSNTVENVLVEGALENDNVLWNTSNISSKKISSESKAMLVNSLFEKRQTSKKPPSDTSIFPINSEDSTNSDFLDYMKKMTFASLCKDQSSVKDTPTVVNALYDLDKKTSKMKRNFLDTAPTSQRIATKSSLEGVKFLEEFNLQPPAIFRNQNSAENCLKPLDLPIFQHQQRQDSRVQNIPCDQANEEIRRYPVFLKRKSVFSTRNQTRYEGQRQGRLCPENGKSKVVIIGHSNPQGYGDSTFRNEANIPDMLSRNNRGQNSQAEGSGQTFQKSSHSFRMASLNTIQLQDGRQIPEPYQVHDGSCRNIGQQVDQQLLPQFVFKTELKNGQQVQQLPNMIYENGMMRKVVNHKHTLQELMNNPMDLFAPTTSDVSTAQEIFQHNLSSAHPATRIPDHCVSSHCGNMNLGSSRDHNFVQPEVQLFGRRDGFGPTKKEPETFCNQNIINPPIFNDQISHGQNYGFLSSKDKNYNYKYIIDPRCPQAGYKWNQIDQSNTQVHHHVIQPAYNVNDAYRQQHLTHNYYPTDS